MPAERTSSTSGPVSASLSTNLASVAAALREISASVSLGSSSSPASELCVGDEGPGPPWPSPGGAAGYRLGPRRPPPPPLRPPRRPPPRPTRRTPSPRRPPRLPPPGSPSRTPGTPATRVGAPDARRPVGRGRGRLVRGRGVLLCRHRDLATVLLLARHARQLRGHMPLSSSSSSSPRLRLPAPERGRRGSASAHALSCEASHQSPKILHDNARVKSGVV